MAPSWADQKQIAVIFTGHAFAEGATTILDALSRRRIHASFFLTGVFLRDPHKAPLIRRMVSDGHYSICASMNLPAG